MKPLSSLNSRWIWLPPILISLIALLINIPILDNKFVYWDDGYSWFKNTQLINPWKSWEDIKWIFSFEQTLRLVPVSWVIYKGIISINGMDPLFVRIASLIFHTANAVLLFQICKILLKNSNKPELWAGLITLYWLVNPLRVEPVAWATGLTYPISTFWAFLCFFLILKNKNEILSTDILALICSILAVLSYPVALTVPLTIPVLLYIRATLYNRDLRFKDKRFLLMTLIGMCVSITMVSLTTYSVLTTDSPWSKAGSTTLDLRQMVYNGSNSFFYFIYTSFFPPREITPSHYAGEETFFPEIYIIGLIFLGTCLGYIIRSDKHRYLIASLMTVYATLVLPTLKIFGDSNLQADRFSYLHSWIPILIITIIVRKYTLNKRLNLYLIALLVSWLGYLFYLSYKQHKIWQDTTVLAKHIYKTKYFSKNETPKLFIKWGLAEEAQDLGLYQEAYERYSNIRDLKFDGSKEKSEELLNNFFIYLLVKNSSGDIKAREFLESMPPKMLEQRLINIQTVLKEFESKEKK